MRPLKLLSTLASLALLSGCILVDDFGSRWAQAKPDTCLSDIAKSLYVAEFRRDPGDVKMDDLAHGLTMDGQNYLLLKKNPTDKGGRIYRFTMSTGQATHVVFQRWRLDPAMRETFTHDYPHSVAKLDRDTVTLPNLEGESEKLLAEIANKPEYWQIDDQTLYNTIHNPKCRFDPRDLAHPYDERKAAPGIKRHGGAYHGGIEPMAAPEGVQ